MGQRLSSNKQKLPPIWILRCQNKTNNLHTEEPIKFQYKSKKRSVEYSVKEKEGITKKSNINNCQNSDIKLNGLYESQYKLVRTQDSQLVSRTKSEPNLSDNKYKYKKKSPKLRNVKECTGYSTFGYDIDDVDDFLSNATIDKPANIPVVLSFASVLYQTRIGGYQDEISLPLGMVVNAVFKNQNWLYVQTPHAEEGYIRYTACIPLGIIPTNNSSLPCWENSRDVFPRPSGNMTDTDKLSSKSECSSGKCRTSRRPKNTASTCSERSFDKLYLRAASNKNRGIKQTLLVIFSDYKQENESTLTVHKGEVVTLLGTHVQGWFWVKRKEGKEGFIPAAVAGHGFL